MTCKIKHTLKVPYAQIAHEIFLNPRLSMKAKGLLGWLLSKPDDWEFNVQGILTQCSDGRDSIISGLKELEKEGYLFREQPKDENNRFLPNVWHILHHSNNFSVTGFSDNGSPVNEKPPTSNNKEEKMNKKEEDPPLTPPLNRSSRLHAVLKTFEKWKQEGRPQEIIDRVAKCYYEQPKGKVLKIPAWLESVYAQKQEEYAMEPVYSARRRFIESRPLNYSIKGDEVTYTSGSCEKKISLRGSESFWKNHNLDTETILNKHREDKET